MHDSIRFDGWTLLRSTGELTRGDARTRLQAQPLQVLEELLAHPGELVSREQMIARLWPDGVVVDFDTALNSAIHRLRIALGDHAERPRYIETIPRRGYRFIGQLELQGTAVLADGLPQGAARPPPSASLDTSSVAADKASRPWSFAAGTVVVAATALLTGWLTLRGDSAAPGAAQPAQVQVSAAARERYDRGRFFFNRRGPGDTTRALALYEEALRTDPGFAAAWAGIASVRWIDTMEERIARAEGLPLTRYAAEHALAHDPANVEALLRLSNYHRASGDIATGEAVLRKAAALAPDDALLLSFRADDAARAGRFEEAIELQSKAVQRTPLAVPARQNLAMLLFLAGRFDESRAALAQLNAISSPREQPEIVIGQSLLLGGDHLGALAFARGLPDGAVRTQLEALALFALGRRAEADAALQKLQTQTTSGMAYRVAEVHAYRGEIDPAFVWLQRFAIAGDEQCVAVDCWPSNWVPALPLLQSLRSDPRWHAIRMALST